MDQDIKNIFVSHYHSDAKHIEGIKTIIGEAGITARDSSIYEAKAKNNANNPEYIKSLIRPQIDWAGTVIVLIGANTSQSDWVNWEVEYAAANEKQIVGVFLEGATDADIPDALKNDAGSLVDWDSDHISQALNGEDIWLNPDGTPRTQSIVISRGTC